MPENVLTELREGVFKITLNRPKANAFSLAMIAELQQAFKEAARNPQARCLLLSGAGGTFSAGQDVHEIAQAQGQSFRQHLQNTYNPLVLQIRRIEKPVLAALHGTTAGAALGIALACDLRIAADEARFVVGFLGIGLGLDSGISLFLPALAGLGRASEAAFSNEPIPASLALEWGLVNRLAPLAELDECAFAWAADLARGPVAAMGLAKRAFNKAVYPNLEQALDYEAHLQEIARQGDELKEGAQAFLEKRPPQFKK